MSDFHDNRDDASDFNPTAIYIPHNGSSSTNSATSSFGGSQQNHTLSLGALNLKSQQGSTLQSTLINDNMGPVAKDNGLLQLQSQLQNIPEVSRDEISRQIFGDVGDLIDDFSCAVESTVLLHGRMYITNRFLCFYSNLFGLEKKIRIPYSHITLVTKENTALVIPNAMAVTTHRKEYLFRSFWDRDECFKLIQDLMQRNRSGMAGLQTAVPNIDFQANSESRESLKKNRQSVMVSNQNNALSTRPVIATNPSTLDDDFETESDLALSDRGEADVVIDQKLSFNEEVAKLKLKISVLNDALPMTIADFIALFLDDNARHSLKSYHESVGDKNLTVNSWVETSLGFCREMKFLKPIPSIKSSTRGVKVQRYRKFGDYGLLICSSTRLEDVPAADTFSVEDMIIIRQLEAEKISVEIHFEVKFIKSTMFRYMIENGTNNEMMKWLENYFALFKSASSKPAVTISSQTKALPSETSSSGQILAVDSSALTDRDNLSRELHPDGSSGKEIAPVTEIPASVTTDYSLPFAVLLVVAIVISLLLGLLVKLHVRQTMLEAEVSQLKAAIERSCGRIQLS